MRVLALDGGGARGLLQARLLVQVEQALNTGIGSSRRLPIGMFFDFVVGTSVGGLVALAISAGKSAEEIRAYIDDCLNDVFARPRSRLGRWFTAKYRQESLLRSAKTFFGEATLAELGRASGKFPHACVVALNTENRRTRLLKTGYSQHLLELASTTKVYDAALATSAAPTYFPAARITLNKARTTLVDGGLVANNPSLIAVLEASKILSGSHDELFPEGVAKHLPDIALISVGTCRPPTNGKGANPKEGLAWWALHFHELTLDAQAQHAEYFVHRLMPSNNYVRIDPRLEKEVELDDIAGVTSVLGTTNLEGELETKMKAWARADWPAYQFPSTADLANGKRGNVVAWSAE